MLVGLFGLALSIGCGKGETPVPVAPVPTTPTTGYGAGGCASVSGQVPFNQNNQPIMGTLTMMSGGYGSSNANSLSLNFYYQYFDTGYSTIHSIVASGMFYYPDLLLMLRGGQQQNGYQIPYSFCESSADPTTGTPLPGVYAQQDSSVAITLRGMVQVPLYTYSPFDSYPYGYNNQMQGTQATLVEVSIGNSYDCGAIIANGRLYGCVDVSIGNNSAMSGYRFRYQSR